MLGNVEEMEEKLKAEPVSFHRHLVAKSATHARALVDTIWLQRDWKKISDEKVGFPWLLAEEKAKQEDAAVIKHFKKDVSSVTLKATEEIDDPTTSLEKAVKKGKRLMR